MADKVIPVKVALRIRPLVPREQTEACTECVRTIPGEQQIILGKDKAFTYDYVFSQTSPQVEIYETSVQPLLGSLFKGYNATVLAYGQTGSGKTHTMGSGYNTLSAATLAAQTNGDAMPLLNTPDFEEVGVIPRVLNDLFRRIDEEQRQNSDNKFSVKVSFVEVYNEEIKDLFNMKSLNGGPSESLNIREENNSIRVVNLSETVVTDAFTTIQLLEKGSSMRVVGGTAMNDQSSRSHAIFTITLEQSSSKSELIKSKFHLVDLAGSERQSKTKAEGIRLKEGININLGLLALGNVISVLGEENYKHVPYRESKLTRLLQDSLGGNSHTVMIACASPADSNMEETLNTLRYADRARKIKNKPIVNIDPQQAELCILRQENQILKATIRQFTGEVGMSTNFLENSNEMIQLKETNEKLKLEIATYLNELHRLTNINRMNYEKIFQLENEKEEQKRKFEEIKLTIEKISKENEETSISPDHSISTSGSQPHNSSKMLINELHCKLGEFEQLRDKEQTAIPNDEDLVTSNEPADKEFTLRQARMQYQLADFDSELVKKQSLHQKMVENLTRTNMTFENLDELKSRIECLEREKEELQSVIKSSDKKLSEQKKDKLKQLEAECAELKRKEKDSQRMLKLKEENEKNCEKLRNEIQHIKQERVKLIKQMKTDNDSFRRYKTEKEKEVNQLKAMERKRLVEISKLQIGNNRQEMVLRRKNDEISRIQKQLRETSEKQKQVAEKRQQTFDRKDSSQLGEKLRSWITQELELSVGLAEARLNLNKLLEERKEAAAELLTLTDKLENEVACNEMPPPMKRKHMNADFDATYTSNAVLGDEEDSESLKKTRFELEKRIERIKEDIEMKNVQINEIQQMVIEGDQDDKSKHLFNNIHGLLEAKVLLKHLYNNGVQYLLDSKLKQQAFEAAANGLTLELKENKKRCETAEEELAKFKKENDKELSRLIQHYEQRILILLKTGLNDLPSDERVNIILDQIKSMEKKIDKDISGETVKGETLGGTKDEYKRTQRLKRDHRRTRVIRTAEVEPLMNRSNMKQETLLEDSPNMSPYSGGVAATPDDKIKDPDWANPWAKTPLGAKNRSNHTFIRRTDRFSKRLSKTKLQLPTIEADSNCTSNDENKI